MKQYQSRFVEGLVGLRAAERARRGTQSLRECRNLKPSESGLIGITPLSGCVALTGPTALDWPFPQIFFGKTYCILATRTRIYEVNTTTWALTLKLIVPSGTIWDFADFGSYFFMTNGVCQVYLDLTGAPTYTTTTSTTKIPGAGAACNFKGQLILGNIKTTWYGNGSNSVVWSKIGSADFTEDLANVAGGMHIPTSKGEVLRVERLGNAVMIYSNSYIGALIPQERYFGFRNLVGIGIAGKGSIGGDDKQHCFVDSLGYLWKIGVDLEPKRLGYRNYTTEMVAEDLMVSYDSSQGEFYLSDGGVGFLLTNSGLCRTHQRAISVFNYEGVAYGIFDSDGKVGLKLTTDLIDFGQRAFKTLSTIEVGVTTPTPIYLSLDGKYDGTSAFSSTDWIQLNETGTAFPYLTGNDFQINLSAASFADIELDYMNLRFNIPDRRSIRGAFNADKATAGPNSSLLD